MSVSSGGEPPPNKGLTTPNRNEGFNSDMELDSPFGINKITENKSVTDPSVSRIRINSSNSGRSNNEIDVIVEQQMETLSSDRHQKTVNTEKQKRAVYFYDKTNSGPFIIYLENILDDFRGKLNAIKIGDILFKNHPELDSKVNSIDSIGRNRIRIKLKNAESVNYLVKSTCWERENLEAYITKFILHKRGIIKGVDTEHSEEYLKNKIKHLDLHCKFTVESVKRMHYKQLNPDGTKSLLPTKTILITFKSQTLPKYVSINHVRIPVEHYEPKVLLCYNCLRYGHLGKQCRAKIRCLKCAENHSSDNCEKIIPPKCLHCQNDHLTTEIKKCPEFDRQKRIKKLMSESNLSFHEASSQILKVTYSAVSQRNMNTNIGSNVNNKAHQPIENTSFIKESQCSFNYNNSKNQYQNKVPNKRPRTCPNLQATSELHKRILSPITLPSVPITQNPVYVENIESASSQEQNFSISPQLLFNIVISIINMLKQKNSFDIQESEMHSIIAYYFSNLLNNDNNDDA